MRKLLALGLALLGCGPLIEGTPGDLGDILPRPNCELVLNPTGDELTLRYPSDESCVRLVPTTATVNGEAMQPKSLGSGTPYDGERAPADQCVRPTWIVPRRPDDEAVTEFVLSDPSAEIRARFQAVGARRTATLVVPDAGVRAGQRIELEWTPATDILRLEQFSFIQESDGGFARWPPVPAIVSARIPVDVPADAQSGTLSIGGRPVVGVESCEPADRIKCRFVRALEKIDGIERVVLPLTIDRR